MRIGSGYPYDPPRVRPVPQAPLAATVAPNDNGIVANPGDYFQQNPVRTIASGASADDYPTGWSEFLDNSQKVYNCVEIDVEFKRSPTREGYYVPRLIGFMSQSGASYVSPLIPGTQNAGPLIIQASSILVTTQAPYTRRDFLYLPPVTDVTTTLDPFVTSGQIFGSRCFRMYGLQPFNYARVSYWWDNYSTPPAGSYQTIGTAMHPTIYWRLWYDPSVTKLITQ